jgi:hypothetical protein
MLTFFGYVRVIKVYWGATISAAVIAPVLGFPFCASMGFV